MQSNDLYFVEKARVLDRRHRLRGEGLKQVDGARRKLAGLLAADNERTDDAVGAEQRHSQKRAEAGADDDIEHQA